MKNEPIISVVISARNEEKHIGNCLRSIREQTLNKNKIEIIVVDDGSEDKTAKIAKSFEAKVIKSTRNRQLIKNFRGANVNCGVKQSSGNVVFFPDADMTFDPGLFEEITNKSIKSDALYIPETIRGRGLFGDIRNFERSFYNGTSIDAVRVIKKDVYQRVGGYDEKNIVFGPDDWDLTKRIKQVTHNISTTKGKIFHHEELLGWKDFLIKKKKYVKTLDGYISKWGEDDPDVKRQLGVLYRAVIVFTENGKWKKLIKRPDLAFLMYVLRFVTWLCYKFST